MEHLKWAATQTTSCSDDGVVVMCCTTREVTLSNCLTRVTLPHFNAIVPQIHNLDTSHDVSHSPEILN